MSGPADDLVERLREILAERPTTEGELRVLGERASELAQTLEEQLAASEARLTRLSSDPESSLAEAAAELRRVEAMRPALVEMHALLDGLEERARRLRTQWLLRQAEASERPVAGRGDA